MTGHLHDTCNQYKQKNFRAYWNVPLFNLKNKATPVRRYTSIGQSQILHWQKKINSELQVLITNYLSLIKIRTQTKDKLNKYYDYILDNQLMPLPETIETIHDMVLADQGLRVRQTVEAIGISHSSITWVWESESQDG